MAEKGPSKGQKPKFRKTEKNLFSHSPKEHIFKKLGYWIENCGLQRVNRQTDRQTNKKAKTERKKLRKKLSKALKTSKINILKNGKKKLFYYSHKEHIFKKLGYWVENCDLQLDHIQTDRHTDTVITDRSSFRAFRVTSLQPIIKERSKN